MKAMTLLLLSLCAVQVAAASKEDSAEARKEAKEILVAAYNQARAYCERYPSATHVVTVRGGDYELEITVKCEIVNLYFLGALE
jgi:hypothetical protein